VEHVDPVVHMAKFGCAMTGGLKDLEKVNCSVPRWKGNLNSMKFLISAECLGADISERKS
jgi:hypothetical protein